MPLNGEKPAVSLPSNIRGLDGLRAVSVVAVLCYHAHFGWMRGGYLGVEIFFVLSGFLITGLLLKENAATGRIDLPAFWKRRSRRLLPALLAFAFALCTTGVLFLGAQASQFRSDLLASVIYLENWHQIGAKSSYFADQGLPLLRHLWSLSVEGQFYLVWPFLVLGATRVFRGRTWPLALLTVLMAAGSLALMLHFADPGNPSSVKAAESLNRAYLGTDTRAFGLLAGALLAMATLSPRKAGRGLGWALNAASVAALAGLGWLMASTDSQGAFLYHGGFLLVDACTMLLIASLARPSTSWLGGALGWTPLEWIGQRSYGLYLWHWPVFTLLMPERHGFGFFLLRLFLTFVITEISYECLETPIRQGALKRCFAQPTGLRRLALAGLAVVGLLFLGEAIRLARYPAYVDPVEASIRAGEAALDNKAPAPMTCLPPAPALPAPPTKGPLKAGPPLPPIPLPEGLQGIHVTAIGDSVMKGAALSLKKAGDTCLGPEMLLINAEECRAFLSALELIRTYKKADRLGEVVVIHLGTNNSNLSEKAFRKLMELLADRRLVLFLSVKSDKLEACDTVNKTLLSLLAGYPNARFFDWRAAANAHPEFFYADQTHLRPGGADFYAGMLLTQIALHTKAAPEPAATAS